MAITTVASSATSVQLLGTNTNRRNYVINNSATTPLYISFGTSASTTSYSISLQPGDSYESNLVVFTGQINGIWSGSPTGNANITEL
ncbi:MAG TPA: hypothetical protein VFM18_00430 [Methanosarcina sp.]|nr:hypothetical protein [Methanosarcina sp.]